MKQSNYMGLPWLSKRFADLSMTIREPLSIVQPLASKGSLFRGQASDCYPAEDSFSSQVLFSLFSEEEGDGRRPTFEAGQRRAEKGLT